MLELPLVLEVVPLGETQADTTFRLTPATTLSHSYQFPFRINFGPKVTRSHQRVKSFRAWTGSAPGPVPTALELVSVDPIDLGYQQVIAILGICLNFSLYLLVWP